VAPHDRLRGEVAGGTGVERDGFHTGQEQEKPGEGPKLVAGRGVEPRWAGV
jgi:hypothetical protein